MTFACRNIGAEREKKVLDAIEDAFAPYVKDRGLDWEIHIEQVMTQQWPSIPSLHCPMLHASVGGCQEISGQQSLHWPNFTASGLGRRLLQVAPTQHFL